MERVIDMTPYLNREEKSPVYAIAHIPMVVPKPRRSTASVLADLVDLVLSLVLGAGLLIFLLLFLISL